MCKLFVTIRLVGYHRAEIDSFIHSRNVLEIAYPSFMHLASGSIGTVPTWYLFVFVCCCRCCCFFFFIATLRKTHPNDCLPILQKVAWWNDLGAGLVVKTGS